MNAAIRIVALVLDLVLLTAPAVSQGSPIMNERMLRLMEYAYERTGLPVPDVLPVIVHMDHCFLHLAVHGAPCPEDSTVRAVYTTGMILLASNWRSDNVKDKSILLHELVHHMQHHAGIPWDQPCVEEAWEHQAYKVQFDWLRDAGADPYEMFGMDEAYLLSLTTCQGD